MRAIVAGAAIGIALILAGGSAASVADIRAKVAWGESSSALMCRLGVDVTLLSPPIEYGDSYVDIVLRGERIANYPFFVYFQMDKAGGGLKRIHFERPRHGATLGVFTAVIGALESIYGKPDRSCQAPARAPSGYQAATTHLWSVDNDVIRATFRDTTLGAVEDCLDESTVGRCGGPTAQLFIQIGPSAASVDPCR